MFDNLFFEETFTEAVNSFLSQVGVSFFFDCKKTLDNIVYILILVN